MSTPRFRVGYLDRPMHHSFLDAMATAPELEVVRLTLADGADRILAGLAECQGYYVQAARDELPLAWHVTPALLAALPRLRAVSSYGAGYDTIDVPACTAAGIAVLNQAGGNAEGVAEHAVGMMLTLLKRMPEAAHAMRAGGAADRGAFMGRELAGRTVGLVGLGHVGRRVAEVLRLAFGCRVLACDPYLSATDCDARGATKVELPELLAAADIVSVHCPLEAATRGLFGAESFATMRPGAIFVTTARGHIHDEAALLAALRSGHIAGAGLDVWEQEPPPADHPLLTHPCVVATPHTAGVTQESRARVGRFAAEGFIAAARGEALPRLVNPEVLPAYRQRWAQRAPA
ncbi:D-isomer specific 2-hydroxyacid dehydrogenase family protein [Falsiroseomonas sp.]|uniref:NAD(P)-dependent oxidoreductase n=1 Tax=Falsiroseomonas sp. TaxID=2870721 RepID=UPI002736AF70|nr:hydroxyacid dehydrogenase [Falsiroseomonas sp.]MDP3414390.1 hydroxyacid dehydrogenase [Falsiroseomonas sp.]